MFAVPINSLTAICAYLQSSRVEPGTLLIWSHIWSLRLPTMTSRVLSFRAAVFRWRHSCSIRSMQHIKLCPTDKYSTRIPHSVKLFLLINSRLTNLLESCKWRSNSCHLPILDAFYCDLNDNYNALVQHNFAVAQYLCAVQVCYRTKTMGYTYHSLASYLLV